MVGKGTARSPLRVDQHSYRSGRALECAPYQIDGSADQRVYLKVKVVLPTT
jgi:hypothetical protein